MLTAFFAGFARALRIVCKIAAASGLGLIGVVVALSFVCHESAPRFYLLSDPILRKAEIGSKAHISAARVSAFQVRAWDVASPVTRVFL
jgi:hypothetical protein